MQKLFEYWADRNPYWEIKYEDNILKTFSDYGRGSSVFQEARGKIFGAGYEVLIIAFFLGLYNDKRKPLIGDSSKRKVLGQPIKYWGNLDSKPGRQAYPNIRKYMFAALIARTDIDFIALDLLAAEEAGLGRKNCSAAFENLDFALAAVGLSATG